MHSAITVRKGLVPTTNGRAFVDDAVSDVSGRHTILTITLVSLALVAAFKLACCSFIVDFEVCCCHYIKVNRVAPQYQEYGDGTRNVFRNEATYLICTDLFE